MSSNVPKPQWDTFATQYCSLEDLPGEILATRLLRNTLGDIRGQTILDLGCGTGLYARMVLSMGAARVVGVDIASDMVDVGRQLAESQGHADRTKYHVSNCAKSLDHLKLGHQSYDIVMGNWLLSYPENQAELEGMWRNISIHLKPGGRFIGLMVSFRRELEAALKSGKYGMKATALEEIENGQKLHLEAATEPKIKFYNVKLHRRLFEIAAPKAGMVEMAFTPPTAKDLPPKADMEFWKEMLDSPYLMICTAIKAR
jgi:toxoflavin synthase